MQSLAVPNRQVTDEFKQDNEKFKKKMNKHDSYLDNIKTFLKQALFQNQTPLSCKMGSPKYQDTTNVVPENNTAPPLEGGHSTKKWWHVGSQTQYQLTKII